MLVESLSLQSLNSEILMIEGIQADRVAKVGPTYNIKDEVNPASLKQWEHLAKSLSCKPTEADIYPAFVDTLIAYPTYDKLNVFARFYPTWHTTTFGDQASDASAAIFQEQVMKVCHGRCFFVTEKGHMGLGPPKCRKVI
jgi:hypothetical protein